MNNESLHKFKVGLVKLIKKILKCYDYFSKKKNKKIIYTQTEFYIPFYKKVKNFRLS